MRTALLAAILVLSACGGGSDDAEADSSALYDAAREPLDKADAVEDQLLESKQQIDAALDEADGG